MIIITVPSPACAHCMAWAIGGTGGEPGTLGQVEEPKKAWTKTTLKTVGASMIMHSHRPILLRKREAKNQQPSEKNKPNADWPISDSVEKPNERKAGLLAVIFSYTGTISMT